MVRQVEQIKAKEEKLMSIMSITETLKDVIEQSNELLLGKRESKNEKDLLREEINNQLTIFATLDILKEEFLKTSSKLLIKGNQTVFEIFNEKKEAIRKRMDL